MSMITVQDLTVLEYFYSWMFRKITIINIRAVKLKSIFYLTDSEHRNKIQTKTKKRQTVTELIECINQTKSIFGRL